jgi:hypothetical protein
VFQRLATSGPIHFALPSVKIFIPCPKKAAPNLVHVTGKFLGKL